MLYAIINSKESQAIQMKAFGIQSYGPPSVIQEYTKDEPIPKDNQVKIKVSAFAINPYDASMRRGNFQDQRALKFPFILGSDLVGKIVEVGTAVNDYQIGDFVINHRASGAYSEYVTATTAKIMPLPAGLDLAQAASLPTPGIAAYNAWHAFANIQSNDVIGIVGVGGAVGSLIAQIAHAAGHRVIGVAKGRHQELAKELQVDQFIAYDQLPEEETWQHQADVVFNTIFAGSDQHLSEQLVKENGQLVFFTGVPDDLNLPNVDTVAVGFRKDLKDADVFAFWSDFLAEHPLQLAVQQTFPFEQEAIVKAHELIESHHQGKLVVWVN